MRKKRNRDVSRPFLTPSQCTPSSSLAFRRGQPVFLSKAGKQPSLQLSSKRITGEDLEALASIVGEGSLRGVGMPNALQREGLRAKKMLRKQGSSVWKEAPGKRVSPGASARVSPEGSEPNSRNSSNPGSTANSQPGSRVGSRQANRRGSKSSK